MTITKQRAAKHGGLKGLRSPWWMGSLIQGEQPRRAGVGMRSPPAIPLVLAARGATMTSELR
jgi:hypothetical protein